MCADIGMRSKGRTTQRNITDDRDPYEKCNTFIDLIFQNLTKNWTGMSKKMYSRKIIGSEG